MKNLRQTFFTICLWLICASGITAQEFLDPNKIPDQYNYEHWSSDDGLPDNAVIDILQSHDGYIWFASYGGITRFNGVEFFSYSSYTHPVIVNNSFTSIFEDFDGRIWAATSGSGVVSIKGDEVEAYTKNEGLPSNFAENFAQTSDSILWIATSAGLVYKQGTLVTNSGIPEILKHNYIVSLSVDDKDHLWVATDSDGVYEVYLNAIVNHFTAKQGLLSNKTNYVKFQKGEIYIGGPSGLNIIDNGKIISLDNSMGIANNTVIASEMSENGWLWIGSYSGFCRYKNGAIEYFSKQHPISGRDITAILEDKEGNIWASTYRGGLYKFWEGKFTNYCDYSIGPSEPYTVHTILQRAENEYMLIYEEGVSKIDTKTNELKYYDNQLNMVSNKLKCGIVAKDGTLLIGSQYGVVRYKNGTSNTITAKNGLINENVRVLYQDAQDRIWVGTVSGISVFDFKKNSHFNISTENGLSHDYIMSIAEDELGNFWIGTKSGLNYYDHGNITIYNSANGMVGDFVFKTYADKDNALWILGNAGLTRYKNNKFTTITANDGLISNTLFQIIDDNNGYYWITTNQKNVTVFKVKIADLNAFCDGKIQTINSIAYDRSDGIKGTAATSSATSLKASDGKLWFATQFGAEVIDPSNISINSTKPPVVIEHVKLNDVNVDMNSEIIIDYDKNRISIGFASLSYRYPSKNNYKYQLIGYDDDWIVSKGEKETSYTNLAPGNYNFRVIGANNDKIWNNEEAIISFRIKPAFYQTYWFYFLCIVLTVIVIILIYRYRIASLKRSKIELEKIVEARTYEIIQKKEEIEAQHEEIESQRSHITEQNEELKKINTNLAGIVEERTNELKTTYQELLDVNKELDTFIYRSVHDIRGPIARLQGLSHLIKRQTNDPNILNLVGLLNRTSEEMNDVFYKLINIVRMKTSELKFSEVNFADVLKKVLNRFSSSSLGNQFKTTLKVDDDLLLSSNAETIEIILYQIIDNAIKFKKSGKKAEINIEANKDSNGNVVVRIADSGVGIESDQQDKIFDMFYVGNDNINSAGLGLYTVKTAAKILKSSVLITKNAQVDGVTCFEIHLSNHKN